MAKIVVPVELDFGKTKERLKQDVEDALKDPKQLKIQIQESSASQAQKLLKQQTGQFVESVKPLAALSVAAAVGAYFTQQIFNKLSEASGYLKATMKYFDIATNQLLRPIGDAMSEALRPLAIHMIKFSREWIAWSKTPAGQISAAAIAGAILGGLVGATLGALVGFFTGGPGGAVAGGLTGLGLGSAIGAGTLGAAELYDQLIKSLKKPAEGPAITPGQGEGPLGNIGSVTWVPDQSEVEKNFQNAMDNWKKANTSLEDFSTTMSDGANTTETKKTSFFEKFDILGFFTGSHGTQHNLTASDVATGRKSFTTNMSSLNTNIGKASDEASALAERFKNTKAPKAESKQESFGQKVWNAVTGMWEWITGGGKQQGGVFNTPTPVIVGEGAEPEIIAPLSAVQHQGNQTFNFSPSVNVSLPIGASIADQAIATQRTKSALSEMLLEFEDVATRTKRRYGVGVV